MRQRTYEKTERERERTGEQEKRRESNGNAYGGSVMGNARSKEEARGDAERREDMLAAFTDMAQGKFLDKVAHVTSKDIKNLPVDKYVLVDVREDALRKVSHIPGSITQGDFERKRKEDKGAFAGKTVITSCTIGYMSGLFAAKLSKDPTFSGDLKNHKGSIMDWCYEGFDLVDDKGETTKNVHGVATKWAKLFPQDKGYNIVL